MNKLLFYLNKFISNDINNTRTQVLYLKPILDSKIKTYFKQARPLKVENKTETDKKKRQKLKLRPAENS